MRAPFRSRPNLDPCDFASGHVVCVAQEDFDAPFMHSGAVRPRSHKITPSGGRSPLHHDPSRSPDNPALAQTLDADRRSVTERPTRGCARIRGVLDHLSIQCADLDASAAFYDKTLATIGGQRIMDFGDSIGYGVPPMPDFWLGKQTTGQGFRESHIAFSAPDRAAVDAFFEAAKQASAEVFHPPRLWPEYHANYYGGFVRDPDGNNVEAVCHLSE